MPRNKQVHNAHKCGVPELADTEVTQPSDLDAWSRALPSEMQERRPGKGNNYRERPGME